MNDTLRGQLRHLLSLVGAILILYMPETKQEVFSLSWELLSGVAMVVAVMIDSWWTKRKTETTEYDI